MLVCDSASAERVGQGEVDRITCRVTCTWWLGTRWATSCPDCMDRLTKHYSHLAEGWFLARKAAWASRCVTTDNADYCMLSMVKVTRLLIKVKSGHEFSLESELRQI